MENNDSHEYPWIEIRDAVTNPSPYLDVILQMSPGEIITLFREAEAREREAETSEDADDNEFYRWQNIATDINHALEQLPQRDLEHARAVYAAFASSALDVDREKGAYTAYVIVRFDYEFGMQLWDRLLRDRNRDVRLLAREPLELYLGREEFAEEGLSRLGLTWKDAYQLMRAFAYAERGWDQYDIGQAAVRRVLEVQLEEPDKPS
jgi:hypothetical protein